MMKKINLGEQIPDFTVAATGEKDITLSQLKGQNIILYFYPKDSTPGCTTEGKDFSANFIHFKKLNTLIFGVSRDSIKSHQRFKEKQNFPFDLLSDCDENLCKLFDVIQLKKLYGREYMGIERSTFFIDSTGKLLQEWRKIKLKGHVDEVLEFVTNYPKP